MSQSHLKYCCANPECQHKFTVDEATHIHGIVQLTFAGTGRDHSLGVPLVHLTCPKCSTIATSIHIPADPI